MRGRDSNDPKIIEAKRQASFLNSVELVLQTEPKYDNLVVLFPGPDGLYYRRIEIKPADISKSIEGHVQIDLNITGFEREPYDSGNVRAVLEETVRNEHDAAVAFARYKGKGMIDEKDFLRTAAKAYLDCREAYRKLL